MPPSKKKLKNIHKQAVRRTPKSKARAKKKVQIEAGKEYKDSRRAAAAATASNKGERVATPLDVVFSSGDVEDADIPVVDDAALWEADRNDVAVNSEEEVKAIQKADPELYRFLVDGTVGLLQDAQGMEASTHASARVITTARWRLFQESAQTSIIAFKASLACYRAAAERFTLASGSASGARRLASPMRLGEGEEALAFVIIEWTHANAVNLLQRHGGGDPSATPADPTKLPRFVRVQAAAAYFFEETRQLFSSLRPTDDATGLVLVQAALRSVSGQQALTWLWPLTAVRGRLLTSCCELWAQESTPEALRLLNFLVVRNLAAMATVAPQDGHDRKGDKKGDKKGRPVSSAAKPRGLELEAVLRAALRGLASASMAPCTLKTAASFRLMENCCLELLRIDDATTYRVAFAHTEQLAAILRNACAATQGDENALSTRAVRDLVGWSFVRALRLWTRATSVLPCLRPLAPPLAAIAAGALKSQLPRGVRYLPFTCQCIGCLNDLSSGIEAFVPVSSHLLRSFGGLISALDKAHKVRNKASGNGGAPQVADVDITLKLTERQASEVASLEAIGARLCFLLVDYLGTVSRATCFPEIIVPLLPHLKKFASKCRSEGLRKQLKQLATAAEVGAQDIAARREILMGADAANASKRFLLYEADNAMAKLRVEAYARREREEKTRLGGELKAPAGGGMSKSALKRKRQQESQWKKDSVN